METWSKNKTNLIILLIALINVIAHLLVYNNLEYMRDELLYFSIGKHPAAGFATTPPFIGILSFLLQKTIGYSLFTVRIMPALGSGLIIYMTALITKELGGKDYAQILSAFAVLISPFALRTFLLYQPVFIDLLFWTLVLILLVKFVNTNSPKYLIYLGIAAGFSLMNKYLIAILFFTILLVIAFTNHRTIYTKKQIYLGFLAGFIIFLPNLIWQILNDFPVINHMSELHNTQLVYVDRFAFLIDQLIMPFFASLLIIPGLVFLFINQNMKKYRFIGIIIILVVGILCLLRAKSYYTQGVFPFLIATGAVWFEYKIKNKFVRYSIIPFFILLIIPILPLTLPVEKADGLVRYFKNLEDKYGITVGRRFEDGNIHSLPQDYADMIGWEELTSITNAAVKKVEKKDSYFIYCENYGQAGAIFIIGEKYGLPEPACFSDAFRKWIPRSFNPDIEEFIYINDEPGEDVIALFESIEKVGSITNINSREYGTSVYLCKKPKRSFNAFWKERLEML